MRSATPRGFACRLIPWPLFHSCHTQNLHCPLDRFCLVYLNPGQHCLCYLGRDPWKAWQEDMTELITLRLSRYAARSFWRSSTATHFGGVNGTMTFEEVPCKALADSGRCPASPLNESWWLSWPPKCPLVTCPSALSPTCRTAYKKPGSLNLIDFSKSLVCDLNVLKNGDLCCAQV